MDMPQVLVRTQQQKQGRVLVSLFEMVCKALANFLLSSVWAWDIFRVYMSETKPCSLCGFDAAVTPLSDADQVKCEKCGNFNITRSLLSTTLANRETEEAKELLPYLSAHTRQASERGEIVTLNTANWKNFALAHKGTSISQKVTKLLELIASHTKPGIRVLIDQDADAPLVDAESKDEMNFLLGHVKEMGYVRELGSSDYMLEVKGWEQIEAGKIAGFPGKCFVAMCFHESLNDAYNEGIYLAVKDCGMDPVRIDLVPHNDNIVDKIISEIRSCQFMVADFTKQRGGVYFEAGFAKGLGRPVIWTCQKDDFEKIHFDIAQFSHIIWKDPADLRMRLADKIKATIPGAVLT